MTTNNLNPNTGTRSKVSTHEHTCYYCNAINDLDNARCQQCGNEIILRDRYRITRVLGQGGFGVVYETTDLRLNRHCAVKRVMATSIEEQQQIQNEADILAQHASNLGFMPAIYDVWVAQSQTFMVMEYIDGPSLDQTALPWQPMQVRDFLMTMLVNLARMHAVRIIHRDIKPQNIKYTPRSRSTYMLLDFGIARQGTAMSVKAMSPDYAPPEQAQGLPTDARSDLYSLAATAYHMLTAVSPLQARAQGMGHLPPPRQFAPATSNQLEHMLMDMLAPDPAQRPASARAALAQLGRTPQQAPPPLPLAHDYHQAPATIPVAQNQLGIAARHANRRRAWQYPPRTSYDTADHELVEAMNDLSATLLDSPKAVGRKDVAARPPALWQIVYRQREEQERIAKRIVWWGERLAPMLTIIFCTLLLAFIIFVSHVFHGG